MASVFTITNDTAFQKSGTAVCRHGPSSTSIIRSNAEKDTLQQAYVDIFDGVFPKLGYINASGNAYAEILVKAPNKYNRISLYLKNRLHSVYIEDSSLLNCDPRLGRLTFNGFFEFFSHDRKTCSDSGSDADDLNPWLTKSLCKACVGFNGCGYCSGSHVRSDLCLPRHSRSDCSRTFLQQRSGCSHAAINSVCKWHDHCGSCCHSKVCSWDVVRQACVHNINHHHHHHHRRRRRPIVKNDGITEVEQCNPQAASVMLVTVKMMLFKDCTKSQGNAGARRMRRSVYNLEQVHADDELQL